MDNLEFRKKGRKQKTSTKAKISRALSKGKTKRNAGIGVAATGAVAGLGFVAIKTRNNNKPSGAARSVNTGKGVRSNPKELLGSSANGVLLSNSRGNETRTMPLVKTQTAQIEVISKTNPLSDPVASARKMIPGAERMVKSGQALRAGFDEGKSAAGEAKRLKGISRKVGGAMGRSVGLIRGLSKNELRKKRK